MGHSLRIIIGTLLVVTPSLALAFATLDGDRTRWLANPSYTIGAGSADIDDGSDLAAIRTAFESWTAIAGSSIAPREVNQRGDISVSFNANWPREFGDTTAGITQTERRRGQITASVIEFNNSDFQWTTTGEVDRADVEGVAAHEIGHALGLGHSFYRESTMYWSGADADLATLSEDDQRGMRYLYGDGGEGTVCDTCTGDADCASGPCVRLDANFCSIPCGNGCPENMSCFELAGGDQVCLPSAQVCGDRAAGGMFAEGDYCFGADQCPGDLQCFPLEDARCLRQGSAGFGDTCETGFECASELCLPLTDDLSVCTVECDPARNNCPNDAECIDLDDPELEFDGLCIPGGDVPVGGVCSGAEQRCAGDATCIVPAEGADGTCREACEPFGECARGLGCTPFGEDNWFCLPADGPAAGEDCVDGECAGGLLCLPGEDDEPGLCLKPCDPATAQGCTEGSTCFEVAENLGLCPYVDGAFDDDCEGPLECASFVCVARPDSTGACSRDCAGAADCPEGWFCGRTANGNVCFVDEEGGAGGEGGQGGVGGQGGAGGEGGAGGAGAEGGAGGQGAAGGEGGAGGQGAAGGQGGVGGQGAAGGQGGVGGQGAAGGQGGTGGQGAGGQGGTSQNDGGTTVRRVGDGGDGGCNQSNGQSASSWPAIGILLGLVGFSARRRRRGSRCARRP